MELTFSHKYIKNTSTCGMILTEHLLNAGRRPKTFKRARKARNCIRQKKKRQKRIRTGPEPPRGSVKCENPHTRKSTLQPETLALAVSRGWVLRLGLQRSDPGEDWGGLCGDSLRG